MLFIDSEGKPRKLCTFDLPSHPMGGSLGREASEEDLELALGQIKAARIAVAEANSRRISLMPSGFYGWSA